MERSGRVALAGLALMLIAGLAGCGSNDRPPTNFPAPASISLSPADKVSLDVGSTQSFAATARNRQGVVITTPIKFQSSNTAVLTIANNGLACAGTWDSLSVPQICTPGPVGVADVTATAKGVSSPPTTVYVHQHIDSIQVDAVTPPAPSCVSKDQTFNYKATAFSRGLDITATVGLFTWQTLNATVAQVSTTADGLQIGQVQATAKAPGLTSIFASATGVNSVPLAFTSCAVQSIALEVDAGNSFTVATNGTKTITATVTDTLGNTITGASLTWTSSEPAVMTVSNGSTRGVKPGSSTIITSCIPPTCNIGFSPALLIYPEGVINGTVTGSSPAGTVWVSSTGTDKDDPTKKCADTDGCATRIVPILTPGDVVGPTLDLPAIPNSLLFNPAGGRAYLGTNLGLLGTRGVMELDPTAFTVAHITSVKGKVLAVSQDGRRVIVSHTDPLDPPNQVFVLDTSNRSIVVFPITGATAADFSPDSLKAYIVAGNTLYVFSTIDPLQAVPLGASGAGVSFLSNGAFAYVATDAPGFTVFDNCTNGTADSVSTPAVPTFFETLPNSTQVLTVNSPGVDLFDVVTTPVGCPPTVGHGALTSFNLGQGTFVPTQLILSSDSAKAYVLTSNLASILVFNIASRTSSSIALAGSPTPIQASLASDGTRLYVVASDGMVHVLETLAGIDINQISFPDNFCTEDTLTCQPDLIAVRP